MNISLLHGGHSEISHGRGDPEKFILEAIRIGLKEFGFSEHLPHPNHQNFLYPIEDQQYQDEKNLSWKEYGKRIVGLRSKFGIL